MTTHKSLLAMLAAFSLLFLSACGGGNDGLSKAQEEALQAEVAAAEEARRQAELEKARAEAAAAEARRQREAAEQRRQQEEQARQTAEEERDEIQEQLTEAEQAELRARASSFGAQLDAPEMAPADVEWTRGSSLTFRPQGVVMTPGSSAPSIPGSWRSASFTGQTGTATALVNETVYLYTNIQAPSSRAFWKVHNVEVAATAFGTLEADTVNDPTPTAAAQYITDPADSTMASGVRVSGTYDGVSGTFTCTVSGTCTGERTNVNNNQLDLTGLVGAPNNGVRSFVGGDWSFKPGSITARVKAEDQADEDDAYLYFGIWSSIPDNITGTYNFRYVAGGGAESGTDLANFNALTGSATFSGGAVGRYVTQGQVGGQNAKIGTFTATATLNADFGDGTTAGTLSGSITDFQEGGSPLSGWRVTLGSTGNIGVASTIADAAASGDTVANIGGLSVGGSWGANFHGSDNEVLADRDKYPATTYPVVDLAGVTGWFDATGPDASLAGAFAATPSN